ncbi:N-formylglutamate amidohydrolase [soil metagenome]
MQFATFQRGPSGRAGFPLVATAVHNGHELRPDVDALLLLDEKTRLREEDPYTDFFASAFDTSAIVHRSRFEVDLNRPREIAVYASPEDAWGMDLWTSPITANVQSESLRLYDQFYSDLGTLLDEVVEAHGGFVLYDLHSYNHRRGGPDALAEPAAENPVINLGTGSLPSRWSPVADAFTATMSAQAMGAELLDVRKNVKFRGRQVAAFVHERYGDVACALAIECKKVWMDEWTGTVDASAQTQLRTALLVTIDPVSEAWRASGGH